VLCVPQKGVSPFDYCRECWSVLSTLPSVGLVLSVDRLVVLLTLQPAIMLVVLVVARGACSSQGGRRVDALVVVLALYLE
jgi:hypothetical protein